MFECLTQLLTDKFNLISECICLIDDGNHILKPCVP